MPETSSESSSSAFEAIVWESWKPVDRATLLFVLEEGKILLIRKKRGLGAGKINGPGGRLEGGETVAEGALREVREELRIEARDPRRRGELRFQFVDGYSIHVEVFTAAEYDGTPEETEEAIPLWFTLAEIPYDEMWADDRLWLPAMLQGQPFEGRFLFDGDSMLGHHLELGEASGPPPGAEL